MHKSSILPFFLAIAGGASLPLAFAPFHYLCLAFISPLLLLYLWKESAPTKAFWLGFCFGIGMFGVGTSWIFVSIHRFGNSPVALAIFLTSLFVVGLALFPALQGYLFSKISARHTPLIKILVDFPLLWVTFEWIRSFVLTGFPWLYLGYSQSNTVLKYYAPLGSVYFVSLIILLISGCGALFFLLSNHKKRFAILGILTSFWIGGILLSFPKWTTPIHTPLAVVLVQGNIAPNDKFLLEDPIGHTWQIYGKLTEPHWQTPLIIWPENALPLPLPAANPFVDFLQRHALKHKATLLLGAPVAADTEGKQYYNALLGIGAIKQKSPYFYFKQHLVPFGEFVPFERWLRGLIAFFDLPMSHFITSTHLPNVLSFGASNTTAMPFTCYEIAFPEQVRNSLQHAETIVTVSEDGWFGDSLGPHQHLQIATMRALETGRYVLRATTNGISAIIDPKGNIVTRSPQFKPYVLKGDFQPMRGSTPWTRMGLWPFFSILAVWIGYCFIRQRKRLL